MGKDTLADWSFSVDEVSAGVYRANGVDAAGRTVEAKGADPDATLEQCKQAASEMADTPTSNDQEGA